MAILHSLDGIKIIVEQDTGDNYNPKWGELEPIGATSTTLHYTGKKSPRRKIVGVMCMLEAGGGANDFANLKAGLGSSAVTYVSDQGSQGSYYVFSITPQELQDIGQDVPLYRVTIELMKA
jgi:hypothetical protein